MGSPFSSNSTNRRPIIYYLKKRPTWQNKILTTLPQLDDCFGSGKRQHLQYLNVLTENFQWSEAGFQHMIYILRKVLRRKLAPNAEIFRLWVNDLANMKGNLTANKLPFDWLLCNDLLSGHQKNQARELANLILSAKAKKPVRIEGFISRIQANKINRVLAWFYADPLMRDRNNYLMKLSLIASSIDHKFDWQRMEKGINFVIHHLKKPPDYELLKDYLEGRVDFEGRGEYQR